MIEQDSAIDPHSDCADDRVVKYIQHLEQEVKRLDQENKIMRARLQEDKRWHISHISQVLHIRQGTHG